jgi:hypothetical protein
MGVDKVEAATTEGTPELEARLGEGLLALTAVKGEHVDVYAKRLHVLDQVAHEARRRVGLGSGTCWRDRAHSPDALRRLACHGMRGGACASAGA